jgi:hypothetical protein
MFAWGQQPKIVNETSNASFSHIRVCGLNSMVGQSNVKPYDMWEGIVTTRRETSTEHIHSLGFQDIRMGSQGIPSPTHISKSQH